MGKGKITLVLSTEFIKLINRGRETAFEPKFWTFMVQVRKEENACRGNVFWCAHGYMLEPIRIHSPKNYELFSAL